MKLAEAEHLQNMPGCDMADMDFATVTFSPDGKNVGAGRCDRPFGISKGTRAFESAGLVGHTARVTSVAFAPKDKNLASGADGAVILWDIDVDLK